MAFSCDLATGQKNPNFIYVEKKGGKGKEIQELKSAQETFLYSLCATSKKLLIMNTVDNLLDSFYLFISGSTL